MNQLTESEKRTVRLGTIGISVYLLLFFGFKVLHGVSSVRDGYEKLRVEAATLRLEVQAYESRTIRLQRLMDRFQLDPGRLSTNTVVGQASAAIQQAATSGGLQLGPVRESVSRGTEKELGSIQFDASGQPPMILGFVARIASLGWPIIVDAVQLSPDPRNPSMLKVHLSLTVLDFTQWKTRAASHA